MNLKEISCGLDEFAPSGSKRNFYRKMKRLEKENKLPTEFEMSRYYTHAAIYDAFKKLIYCTGVIVLGSFALFKYGPELPSLETIIDRLPF